MKKLFLLTTLIGFALLANAQSDAFHAFKFDIGLGGALPSDGSGTEGGVTFTLQPHYRLTDEFAIGLRLEAAVIGYKTTDDEGGSKIKGAAIASYCVTGEYYLSNRDRDFRPFIGAGAGLFDQESVAGNSGNGQDGGSVNLSGRSTGFGVFPEAGFEAGHFRFSIDYNVVGNSNSYLGASIGAFFGGGRKKTGEVKNM